jgi:hypothetical protein
MLLLIIFNLLGDSVMVGVVVSNVVDREFDSPSGQNQKL